MSLTHAPSLFLSLPLNQAPGSAMLLGEVLLLLGTVSVGTALSTGAVGDSDGFSIHGGPLNGRPLSPFNDGMASSLGGGPPPSEVTHVSV